jgi:hypothetical protein
MSQVKNMDMLRIGTLAGGSLEKNPLLNEI